jgi:hypothetical protein
MRQKIAGLIAGVVLAATMSAAPVQACTALDPCGGYGSYGYGAGCGTGLGCGNGFGYNYNRGYGYDAGYGYGYEHLPDPSAGFSYQSPQYYYVNQGPTYTGPGNWAPLPTYQERAVRGWQAYRQPYYYGYNGGPYANASHHYYDGAPGVSGPVVYSYRWGRRYQAHTRYRPHRGPKYYYAARPGARYGYAARHAYPRFRHAPADSLANGARIPMKPHTYKF